MTFDNIFSESFDTFKVFNNMNTSKASWTNLNTPKSIWQILNHLITWQEFQLKKLLGANAADIDELNTWIKDTGIEDQEILLKSVKIFYNQIDQIKLEISCLTTESENIEGKLKVIQDLSTHLSFHLGEIILLLRQNGHYPMPREMESFLANA